MKASLLLLCVGLAAGDPPRVDFELQYLGILGRRQHTLAWDFDGDGKGDLFNCSIDYDQTPPARWAALHVQKAGGYGESPDALWPISDRACALVFGDFLPGGGTEAGFLAEDGVWVYPWAEGRPAEKPIKLLHVRTFFRTPPTHQLPLWQWKMDFDGDGRDDLLVPLPDGYRAYFQTAPGVFGRTATLEGDLPARAPRSLSASGSAEKPDTLPVHFHASLELPKVEWTDINGDGLSDLVLIRKDTVTYFIQKDRGVFPSTRPWRVSFRVPTLATETKKDTVDVAMVRFVDINRDGLADLVVTRVGGELGLWESIKTSIYLHLGTGKGNFIADKRIVIDGVSIDPEFIDMNLDGKLDVVTSRLRTDLMQQAVKAFILGDLTITYEVFQFDPQQNMFLADPVYAQDVRVARRDLEKTGAGAVPLLFIRGDLSGDGRPDVVVVQPGTLELAIHPGLARETGSGARIGFDGTPHWRVKIDRYPKGLHILDVNGDGVNDVVLYYAGTLGLILSKKK